MAKKYVPSGYQIIDLTLTGEEQPFVISKDSSEDAKILWDTLTKHISGKLVKPVLLHLYVENYDADITMLSTIMVDTICFGTPTSSYVGDIRVNGDNLEINVSEQ